MYEDLTIGLCGYNIKWFAVLAVESFLLHYPRLRKNIVYFDDNSTDGTREELESRGIKVITWKYYNERFDEFCNSEHRMNNMNVLSVRVAYIMKEIMQQTDTKYLFISDGDIVFKNGGFLEDYYKNFAEGAKAVGHKEWILCGKLELVDGRELASYYKTRMKFEDEKYWTPRIHLMHAMIDLEYFKSINMLGDTDDFKVMEMIDGTLIDTGSDFYYRMMDNDIPCHFYDWVYTYDKVFHWSWLSSSNRDAGKISVNSRRNQEEEIKKALYEGGIAEICRSVGIHPQKLLISYSKTKGMSEVDD